MLEKLKKVKPFWWFVAFFVAVNILWIGPAILGGGTLKKGSVAPAFSLPLIPDSSERLSLESLRGSTVLLVFWATWCDACLAEIPVVIDLSNRYGDRGLVVVGMNLEPENRPGVGRFLSTSSIPYRNVTVDGQTAAAYRVGVLPAIVLIDRAGTVYKGFTGRTSGFRLARAVERCLDLELPEG
ncbi:MAG: TlpA family protein disulfide reductase [Deltaproteobacteria bacterium]|nr:TlpA family protein disulfide reductase [Deltaproteobacteria bacterium]